MATRDFPDRVFRKDLQAWNSTITSKDSDRPAYKIQKPLIRTRYRTVETEIDMRQGWEIFV